MHAMTQEMMDLQVQIDQIKERLNTLRAECAPEEVKNYVFESASGARSLSDLFGEYTELIVVHNMGASCNYCTLWADGFSGYLRHFRDRCAFVLCSPDSVENQSKLKAARDWKFDMVCDATRDFTADMGYYKDKDGYWPGFSAFHKDADGKIWRTGTSFFGPGDDYCMVWPMFAHLKGGAGDFEPH